MDKKNILQLSCLIVSIKVIGRLPGGIQFSSVQLFSPVLLFSTPWTTTHQASLCITKDREAVVKNLPANARGTRDVGLIPGSGSFSGVGNGNPLQYSCLENYMDRGTWQATVQAYICIYIYIYICFWSKRYFMKKFKKMIKEVVVNQ